jgi:hypothetical protein
MEVWGSETHTLSTLAMLAKQGCQLRVKYYSNGNVLQNATLVFIWGSRAHIYTCTRGREYTKNILKKYNNRKTNTYLIPLSNSWWINNTEFGEVKLMMNTSLSLREEIYQLKLRRHKLKSNNTIMNLWSRKMSINTNMLSKLMLYRITSNTDSSCTIR